MSKCRRRFIDIYADHCRNSHVSWSKIKRSHYSSGRSFLKLKVHLIPLQRGNEEWILLCENRRFKFGETYEKFKEYYFKKVMRDLCIIYRFRQFFQNTTLISGTCIQNLYCDATEAHWVNWNPGFYYRKKKRKIY